MRIVIASSEAIPFSKTGGLADVASSLSKALAKHGHDVTLVTPYYRQILAKANGKVPPLNPLDQTIRVPIGNRMVEGKLVLSTLPGSTVRVVLIDQPQYFDRTSLYGNGEGDYADNCERFAFFSRAVFEAATVLRLEPDILHANDWQTGLIPALLKAEYRWRGGFERTASVFTIHNMAFQGQFWHWDMLLTGLDWKYFNWHQMEFFGKLNLLKTGLSFADKITTVSPTYAREIQTPEFGYGLNGLLYSRRDDLVGILNGIDTEVWNPATDPLLPQRYNHATVSQGKPVCKLAVQNKYGLPDRPEVPLFGMISRMTSQKGLDLILDCMRQLTSLDLQMTFLGTGDPGYEHALKRLAAEFPTKVGVTIGYDEELSHLIEAGADIFLMPSQFEPCGLNQMYSLAYGTVPIVRAVGGLADSVVDASEVTLSQGTANGFSFYEYSSPVFFRQVCRAMGTYLDRKTWLQLIQTGMERDWSWNRSAYEYERAYEQACIHRHAVVN